MVNKYATKTNINQRRGRKGMHRMRFAIGSNRYEQLRQDILGIANEALRRGHIVYWFEFPKLTKRKGIILAPLKRLRYPAKMTDAGMLSEDTPRYTDIELLDVVVIRGGTPLDPKSLKLMSEVCDKVVVINDPHSIMRYEDKKYLLTLKGATIPTYYSTKVKPLKQYIGKLKNCVLKKAISYGGSGIHHVIKKDGKYYSESRDDKKPKEVNIDKLLRQITDNEKQGVVVVKYLKNVGHGDKRIIVIGDQIMGAFLRKPKDKNGWVCNVSSGGSVHKTKLKPEEYKLVKIVVKRFSKERPDILGIDTLENDNGKRIVSEVNSSSVWGMTVIQNTDEKPVIKLLLDHIENKLEKRSGCKL